MLKGLFVFDTDVKISFTCVKLTYVKHKFNVCLEDPILNDLLSSSYYKGKIFIFLKIYEYSVANQEVCNGHKFSKEGGFIFFSFCKKEKENGFIYLPFLHFIICINEGKQT